MHLLGRGRSCKAVGPTERTRAQSWGTRPAVASSLKATMCISVLLGASFPSGRARPRAQRPPCGHKPSSVSNRTRQILATGCSQKSPRLCLIPGVCGEKGQAGAGTGLYLEGWQLLEAEEQQRFPRRSPSLLTSGRRACGSSPDRVLGSALGKGFCEAYESRVMTCPGLGLGWWSSPPR